MIWRVEAYEDVTVPAGTFRAFRLTGRNPANFTTLWYAADLKIIVKESHERLGRHHLGPGKTVHELVQYAPPGGERWYGFGFEATQAAVQQGEGRQAIAFYEKAAADFQRRGLRLEASEAYSAVMWTSQRVGAYQRGVRAGLRAVELLDAEQRNDNIRDKLASVRLNLGYLYRSAGDMDEARRHFEEGAKLTEGFGTARARPWSAEFARGLATLALSTGDYPLAIRHARQAAELYEKSLAALHTESLLDPRRRAALRGLGWTFWALGNAHRRLGQLEAAETFFERGLVIARDLRFVSLEADMLAQLGWTALARRDRSKSLTHFEEAKALASRLNSSPMLLFAHAGIGWSHFWERRYDQALPAFRQALGLIEDVRSELEDPGLRSGFLEDKQGIYHGGVWSALLLGKADEAFTLAERGRSRAFLDLLGNQTILSKGKTRALVEEEVQLRARLAEARAVAQDVTETGERAAAQKQVEAAQRAYRAFLDRVRLESREQASLMTVEPVTLQEVQQLLPPDTTLVEYLVTERESLAWVIDRDRVQVVRLPIRRADLVAEVREFRKSIEDRALVPQVQARAEALHARLFAGVRSHIRGDRVVLVPHDVLHYLPFATLRNPAGRWLVEDFTLATLPSASVLKYLQGKGQGAASAVLAVGNPDLGPALNLRYAEREARSIGARFPDARVLLRQEATKARVKALSGEAGLIHFATHGELNEQDPLSSALLLAPDGSESGRLEVRELFGLDLIARLVVLSACETGLGKLSQGDELVGLQRAFLYAGAPAVVTTLWKVDDRASFLLMRDFYDQLKARGPAEALRRAQGAAMAEFPHPFFWAAFTLTGIPQ
jgi:CHAT domain-containing protein